MTRWHLDLTWDSRTQRRKEFVWRPLLTMVFAISCITQSQMAAAAEDPIIGAARQAEIQLDARIGLAIQDTGSGANWNYNADERFPMASTFKVLACAALLARSDAGDLDRNRRVPIVQTDLVTYSPETEAWVGQEVTLETLRGGPAW